MLRRAPRWVCIGMNQAPDSEGDAGQAPYTACFLLPLDLHSHPGRMDVSRLGHRLLRLTI